MSNSLTIIPYHDYNGLSAKAIATVIDGMRDAARAQAAVGNQIQRRGSWYEASLQRLETWLEHTSFVGWIIAKQEARSRARAEVLRQMTEIDTKWFENWKLRR